MRWIRAFLLFVTGTLAGMLIMQAGAAPQEELKGLRLNHVGMYVKNFDESVKFYTKTMGFHEAFSLKDKEGKPNLAYLQINHDTFLELAPADADHPVGFSHAGLWADDVNATVATLRSRGVKLDDPKVLSTKAPLTNLIDPNGLRLEILEFAPDSLQRKAIDSWK